MIRGLGLYSADEVISIADVHNWEGPGDAPVERKLDELRERLSGVPDAFMWIGLFEPTRQELQIVGDFLQLNPLQVEDSANPAQRAKVELDDAGHGLFVLKTMEYKPRTMEVLTGQLAVFVGEQYVVTVRTGQIGDLRPIRERVETTWEIRANGPRGALYAIMDAVVDEYLHVSDEIALGIEEIETVVFDVRYPQIPADRIYRLKRENIEIRRGSAPLLGLAQDMVNARAPWVPAGLRANFQDVGDHLMRVNDAVEAADNLLLSLLTTATSLQDHQQNSDMRKISAYASMALVPTMIAGIYGMNFDNMPELHWQYMYYAVLGLMGTVVGFLYWRFKKSGWL